nr:hypothetical protein [Tanacetum cinerariifolium]
MTSLVDKAILSGADNRPPMLEKDMYDSWKSRMELYMLNRQHGRMIIESIESGPLLWPSIEENGVTRLKKYSELSPTEAIQADCDVKATNIILQGLLPEVYALVSTHKVTKELWERIQMLMQGTLLTKQERKCKLYDEFDKFAYRKGESLCDYYLSFSLLLNDMNIYNMKLEQFQVNMKFLNTLPPEWSKFVTDVKYPSTNNQLRISSNPHQQATINNRRVTIQLIQGRQNSMTVSSSRPYTSGSSGTSRKQRVIVCYNCKGECHMSKQYTKPKRRRDEQWFKDKVLLVQAQANGQVLQEEELEFLADLGIAETSMQPEEPTLSVSTTIVEVPKELPKVSMVNSSLKKLKFYLASFDMAVEQHCVEKTKFQDKMENVLKDNERLLEQAISIDIVNIVVHDHVNSAYKTVNVCERCVPIETELQKNFINKECYDTLFKKFNTLEKHCISLEVDNQLKKENFQRNNTISQQSAPTFDQLFEINDLKAQSQEKDTVIMKLKERLNLQEKILVIAALKETLNRLKGKPVVNEAVSLYSIDLELLKIDVAPLALKLRVNLLSRASGSQPQGNTKNDRIQRAPRKMFTTVGLIWKPTGRTFTLVGNVCPLTRIATTAIVPLREPIPIESNSDKPVVKLVYSKKSKAAKKKVPVSNLKINKSVVANKTDPKNSWGSTSSNVPSLLIECRNDHVAKIMNYGDYKIGNVMISRVYFMEGLGHNLFSVGQFCDSYLEVAFRQHTCFIRNLDGVDLLTACAMGKSTKKSYKPKSKDTNQEKLYLLHMDLCGPMRVESVNGKKYILVIVDDYSRFTWVKLFRSKDEAPDFIIRFLKMIQVRLKVPVHRIRTDNGTEFVNQTLREYYEEDGISHETSVTPYELLHNKLPDLSYLYVFGALCYSTNDSENLEKLQPKADIGIFIGYAPTKKAFRIYNRRTRRIVETIHVDFDELTAMASEQSSSGPALNEMSPAIISSGLVQKSSSLTPYVPPLRNDWGLLFQPMFDELLNPPPSVDHQAGELIAPIAKVIPPIQADSTGSPSSTTGDQDAPSLSKSHTTAGTQSLVIPQDVEEDNLDIKVAHIGNDPLISVPIPEVNSDQSSSMVSPHQIVQPDHPIPQHTSKWTKDHPL